MNIKLFLSSFHFVIQVMIILNNLRKYFNIEEEI
jgi:hypothetical protein